MAIADRSTQNAEGLNIDALPIDNNTLKYKLRNIFYIL